MVGLDNKIAQIAFEVLDDAALEGVVARLQAAAPTLDVRQWRKLSLIMGAMDATMGGVVLSGWG